MDAGALKGRLAAPLAPLARGERVTFAVLSLIVALTRWPAVARSLWDWDEALFVLAMRDYDVAAYHPHPPGFPLFIGAAKLVPLDPFHALQTVVVLSSLFVFPAAFFLARELRASAFVSASSALLLAFMPNVWLFGGTAFSDVPSLVLSLASCALLLRGCRSDGALYAGCAVLGIAAGIRPQNLLIGLVPVILALMARRGVALRGLGITILIVAGSYGAAARLSGDLATYLATLEHHGRYIRSVDSFQSELRPSLFRVADDFFLRPFRAPAINAVLAILCAAGLLRRKAHALMTLAIFGPFLLFAWLFLDFHSTSRFSIAYMPLFAVLAADGLDAAPARVRVAALTLVAGLMSAWTLPALLIVHRTDSPPVAAMQYIRDTADPQTTFIEVDERLGPHAEVFLGAFERNRRGQRRVLRVVEGGGMTEFTRPRERLAGIVRPRYFEVSVSR